MTHVQTTIIKKLLDGHHIGVAGAGLIRLRDAACNPVLGISRSTFDSLRKWDLLRKKKDRWVVNRKTIISMHGNCSLKRLYKGKLQDKILQNTPPP